MTRKLTSPVVNTESEAFFNAARQGRFTDSGLHGVRQGALVSAGHLPVLRQRQGRMARSFR